MKKLTLIEIAKIFKKDLKKGQWILVQDRDNHRGILFEQDGSIAFQYQEEFCAYVYPIEKYKVIKVSSPNDEFLEKLETK